jgi:DNA-binding MarR family transcriptional regulator
MTESSALPDPVSATSTPSAEVLEQDTLIAQFELTDVVSHLLRRAHFRAEGLFMETFADEDLTPRQKALLITVCKHPGATQNQLADFIALDRNSLAEMVNRMVRKGYLQRKRAEGDGRAYAVHITQNGLGLLQRVLPRDREVEDAIIAVLPEEYRALFMKCLKMVAGVAP